MSISDNLLKVQENINNALIRAGRKDDVTFIAVTKTVDVQRINEAIKAGAKNLGENKVQEVMDKFDKINDKVNWHMIGHLQTNKVKYIIDKVCLIHSLDRISLAEEIDKRAKGKNIIKDVLLEVNIGEEESKFGLKKEEVVPFVENVLNFENLRIKGLMTVAPFSEKPEDVRYVFRELKKLGENIESRHYENVEMKFYSMGMTNDYEIAIEEGSNMVRIGTAIFGKRVY